MMKITKKKLDDMYRSYCASYITIGGETCALIASEEEGYPCYMYSGKDFEKKETVWEKGGGCMSIIPIPNKENEFLAIVDFYLKVSPSKAKVVWGKYDAETGWEIKDVLYLPYLHRFDIYAVDGVNYFVGATIADDKDFKDDWSRSGSIYYGVLPEDPTEGVELKVLGKGYFRNHGYYKDYEGDKPVGYFTSDQGIIKVTPFADKEWEIEQILDTPIGEVALLDIDSDGTKEMITIEPFHGDSIKIYKNTANGYEAVYEYPHKIDFAHTLVGTTLRGVPSFVGGIRRENCDLFYIQYVDGEFKTEIVDKGCGPSNIAVVNEADRDIIISANHTGNEAAVYIVED